MNLKRPALWAVLFTICGIYFRLGISKGICLAFFVFVVYVVSCFVKKRQLKAILILVGVLFLSFFIAGKSTAEPFPSLDGTTLSNAMGVIREEGVTTTGKQKLFIRIENPISESRQKEVDIYAIYDGEETFQHGDTVYISGQILPLNGKSIPGGFDEKLYLQTKGVDYKIYPDSLVKVGETNSMAVALQRQKEKVFDVFDTVLPQKESGIVKAMVTGEKDAIDQETWDLYVKAGINHILCVSGLHVSLFAVFLHLCIEQGLKQSRRMSALITMICCIVFLCFTGFSPSSVRAVVMIVVSLLGVILFRKGDWLNNLAIAGIIILFVQPLYLWNAGFQLSFITAFGIWVALQVIPKGKSSLVKLKQSVILSVYASLFSYPIVAYHFFNISLVGVFVNILVLPLCGLLLFFSFFTAVAGLIFPPLGAISAGGVYAILKFYEVVCSIAVSIPNSYVLVGAPSILSIALFYLVLIMCSFYGNKCCNYKGILCAILVLGVSIFGNRLVFHRNTIAFLDVGQGDATVISTYDGKAIVIDGGGRFNVEVGKNTGVNVVQPYLEYLGIKELDGIFLTHFDADHMIGVLELCDRVPTKALFIADYPYADTENWDALKEILEKRDIMLYTVNKGDSTTWAGYGKIDCLFPLGGVKYVGDDNNQGSLVLKYEYGGTKTLLTGDATVEAERVMLALKADVSAEILKLGHHGSKFSSSEGFLKEVSPEVAIISCGKSNIYGHPNEETLQRLKNEDTNVYRTDEQGTILGKLSPKGSYQIEAIAEREAVYERVKKTMEKW